MKKSIPKSLSLRQLSSFTLRKRELGSTYVVYAVLTDGDVHFIGYVHSRRVPTQKMIVRVVETMPGFVLESVSRIVVSRKDVYRFSSEFALEVPNEVQ